MEGYKLVHVRNRCRIVWVVSIYTCHKTMDLVCFQASTAFAFMSFTTVSWINCCASAVRTPFESRPVTVGRYWWQTERGMALTAIEWVFDGRVAGCGRVPYSHYVTLRQLLDIVTCFYSAKRINTLINAMVSFNEMHGFIMNSKLLCLRCCITAGQTLYLHFTVGWFCFCWFYVLW